MCGNKALLIFNLQAGNALILPLINDYANRSTINGQFLPKNSISGDASKDPTLLGLIILSFPVAPINQTNVQTKHCSPVPSSGSCLLSFLDLYS
jgi:hypothetical protein